MLTVVPLHILYKRYVRFIISENRNVFPFRIIIVYLMQLLRDVGRHCRHSHHAHLVLLMISEVACRGLETGYHNDHTPLNNLCCDIVKILRREFNHSGFIVSLLRECSCLFSLLAHVSTRRDSSCMYGPLKNILRLETEVFLL